MVPSEDLRVLQKQNVVMQETPYSAMPSRQLVELAICRDQRTQLELELAQRLDIALDLIEDDEDQDDA